MIIFPGSAEEVFPVEHGNPCCNGKELAFFPQQGFFNGAAL
jgi:hypothetical protein